MSFTNKARNRSITLGLLTACFCLFLAACGAPVTPRATVTTVIELVPTSTIGNVVTPSPTQPALPTERSSAARPSSQVPAPAATRTPVPSPTPTIPPTEERVATPTPAAATPTVTGTEPATARYRRIITGAGIAGARFQIDPRFGQPVVRFTLTDKGRKAMAKHTRAHIGEYMAITVDGVVILTPAIQGPIAGGQGQISGLSAGEARAVTAQLNSGPLPIRLQVANAATTTPRRITLRVPPSDASTLTAAVWKRTSEVLEARLKALGVTGYQIRRKDAEHILVNLPAGTKNVGRIPGILTATGRVEFLDTGDAPLPAGTRVKTTAGTAGEG